MQKGLYADIPGSDAPICKHWIVSKLVTSRYSF